MFWVFLPLLPFWRCLPPSRLRGHHIWKPNLEIISGCKGPSQTHTVLPSSSARWQHSACLADALGGEFILPIYLNEELRRRSGRTKKRAMATPEEQTTAVEEVVTMTGSATRKVFFSPCSPPLVSVLIVGLSYGYPMNTLH